MEVWKTIEGFDGYEVSDYGRIKKTSSQKILSPYHNKPNDKHLKIQLIRDGKRVKVYVHQCVARTFIPNPDELPEVNHIDGNPENNAVENLEWVTHKQNHLHRHFARLDKLERQQSPLFGFSDYVKNKEYLKKNAD